MTLEILKEIKNLVPFERATFEKFIRAHVVDLENLEEKVQMMLDEVELTVFAGMTLDQLIDSTILAATQNIQNDIEFDKIATRVLLTKIYADVLDVTPADSDFSEVYKRSFKNYIAKGVETKLLDERLGKIFDLDVLANNFLVQHDDDFLYIGLTTAKERYMLHDRDQVLMETPQFMNMRIAMGIALLEKDPTAEALKFYDKLAKKLYIPGGSTNIGAGTTFPVLSNCYLLDTEDDTNHIYDNIKNIALISKATGGIGISVTKLRASGSIVRSNNTMSTGPIPFIKVMDTALKSMSRGGKKFGAMCIYMENWHLDFSEFLDLRLNNGDDYRRLRTADTATYISDEFMKRVVNDEKWYMFNPDETRELTELYGYEFSVKYQEYVDKAERGEMQQFKVMPARELMKKMLISLQGTSHPWLTWKDNINLRALNNNTGTIHCSNLCTEICLPQDRENISVCNLAYINLVRHVKEEGTTIDTQIDWNLLEETVRVLMRHLDNLVDVNASPLKETKHSDLNNRAVGMGMSGFSEALEKLGYAYDSLESYQLMDKVTEFVSYVSIDESCTMAEERGAYANFPGSMWSKGFVPIDTVTKIAKDRLGLAFDESKVTAQNSSNPIAATLEELKSKVQSKLSNSASQDKDVYEMLNQMTELMKSALNSQSSNDLQDPTRDTRIERNTHGYGIELDQDVNLTMDWNKLRERVKKGIRNATTMAIAPNASTGLVLGTSPGVDPRFSQIFSRQTSNGKFLDINHNLVKDLKKLGIWEQVKGKVLENYGDILEIEEIPDNLKEVYKTSFQISPYAYIEVASRAQKWIDQAISRNMYLETRDVEEMIEIYTEAWRRGVKTTYYLHVKPRHQSEQSTVRVNKAEKLNKKGFGSMGTEVKEVVKSVTTAQASLLGETKERKGFGFASVNEAPAAPQIAPVPTRSSGSPVGFGAVKSELQAKVSLKPTPEPAQSLTSEPKMQKPIACPIDPAERALCEACQ